MENTEDYFSLKWSNFRSSLTKGFHDFLREETMVDVTLAAEGKILQAHKLVLSICSPYFKNLFKVNPCKHPIVILKDVGHNDLSYMLEFMYKGEVGIKNEDLPSFLKLADTLKVRGLAGEKIQINENSSAKSLDSNVGRVRNKINRESLSEVCKENNESDVTSEQLEKKIVKNKKRRLSCRSESVKKLKSEKCTSSSVSKCENKSSDNMSEDEDNNPLIKFMGGDNVKNSEGSKQSESLCDNENESQGDNKLSFSVWSDGALDSDDSGGPDINSFLQSVQSDDAEQAPQASALPIVKNPLSIQSPQSSNRGLCQNMSEFLGKDHNSYQNFREENNFNGLGAFGQNRRANPVWDYFQLVGDKAVCKLCHKRLAYKNHMYLTSLSNHLASKRHGHQEHYLEYVSKKNEIVKESISFLKSHTSKCHTQGLTGAFICRCVETGNGFPGGVDYQMIQTKRGRDMLLFAGYTYTQNRMCKDGMRWQCSFPKCKAFCRMSSAGWLTPYKTHHDHPKPSEREIKKRILRMELKARAQSSGATPGEILRNALPAEEFHSTDRACFTRCIQRFRKSLQRKNSKPQEENWQTSGELTQTDKEPLKPQPSTNGEPSWLSHPRPLLPVCDPIKTDGWHAHQNPMLIDKQTQLLDGKGILQEKIESYGM